MSDVKKILTIVDQDIMEEMKKSLPENIIVDKVVTSDSHIIIAPFAIAKEHKKTFYVTDRPNNLKEIFKAHGSGYLPFDIFPTSFGARLVNILTENESISNLSDLFEAEIETLVISQYFQVGSLVDRLTEGASASLNNYLSFHRSLHHLLQFLCYFANKEGFSPIECEKTTLQDGVAVQFSVKLDSQDIKIFKAVILNNENESKNFLTRNFLLSIEDADFTDITVIQKTNRLKVTTFFASKLKARLGGFRFSDSVSLVPRDTKEISINYPVKSKDVRVLDNQFPDVIKNKDEVSEVVSLEVREVVERGSNTTIESNSLNISSELAKENFPKAKKFAFFIKNIREREGLSSENYKLSDVEVLKYLENYPRLDILDQLNDETKSLICVMVRSTKVYENVSLAIEDIGQSGFLERVEEVQKIISSKNIEDIAEIITVKGGKKDYTEEVTKVKGWLEDKKEELIIINSNYDDLPHNEKWEVKKVHINNVLKEEVEKIQSGGEKVTAKDYYKILSEKLGINEEDANYIIEGIVEDSAGDLIVARIEELRGVGNSPNGPEHQKTILVNNSKLEDQIIKMKKIMDGMKSEIIRLRSVAINKEQNDLKAPDFQAQLVQVELDKTKQEIINREKMFKKFREDIDSVLKEKDKQINNLKDKLEQSGFVGDGQQNAKELETKYDNLNLENRTLKTKLEISLRKIQVLSENMDKQDSDFMLRKEREVDLLKKQLSMSQSVISKFKDEKQKLEGEIHHLKDRVASGEMEVASKITDKGNEAEVQKRDVIIQSLSHDKKALEDQVKLQSIEFKKLEQKMKILTVQNDELSKKKGGSAKNVENAQKQVEMANEKTKEAVQEIAEKKKEILKLKNENSIQNVKIQELERKLAALERAKAA